MISNALIMRHENLRKAIGYSFLCKTNITFNNLKVKSIMPVICKISLDAEGNVTNFL